MPHSPSPRDAPRPASKAQRAKREATSKALRTANTAEQRGTANSEQRAARQQPVGQPAPAHSTYSTPHHRVHHRCEPAVSVSATERGPTGSGVCQPQVVWVCDPPLLLSLVSYLSMVCYMHYILLLITFFSLFLSFCVQQQGARVQGEDARCMMHARRCSRCSEHVTSHHD